ncbi:acyltransferase domain-containing protein, partial [Streptomyces sp. NPDC090442]|uniref:acyltransferase domain-containing protein n=1 Tax=Streptomyces sp. NPDC090442 TaxID=3365962 RepID=UPI00381FE206
MHHATLPESLHIDEPSPHVDWTAGAVSLLTEPRPWTTPDDRPRRAAVSSFGISGTNAHLILEQTESTQETDNKPAPTGTVVPWILSARSEAALRAQATRLRERLTELPEVSTTEVGHALVTTRTQFPHRAAVVGTDHTTLMNGLADLATGSGTVTGIASTPGKLAFLFTGQGSQRPGMGRELYAAFPTFAAAFDEACAAFDALGVPLREAMADETVHRTEFAQPALFAVESALFRLWESWGVRPDVVAGHSVGELTAAYAAGVLSLQDAARLVAERGRLMQALPSGGAMLAVQTSEEKVLPLLAGLEGKIALAAVNGPESTVVSGDADAVASIAAHLDELSVKSRQLTVSHAFHSPHMDPMLDDFRAIARGLDFQTPKIALVSTLTGHPATAEELASPDYWAAHAREAVRFHAAVRTLEADGVTTFVELGPDSTLTALTHTSTGTAAVCAASSRKGLPEPQAAVTALAQLHVHGATEIDWRALFGSGARSTDLPTYPFQRERHWLEAPTGHGDLGAVGLTKAEHPLLGAAVELADGQGHLFTGRLSSATQPWLADHAVFGSPLLPGTAMLELMLLAGARLDVPAVRELTLESPLVLPEGTEVDIQLVVGGEDASGARTVRLHSRQPGRAEWVRHATGTLAPAVPDATLQDATAPWPPTGAVPIDIDGAYGLLADHGYDYGPAFQGLRAAWRLGEETFAELRLDEETGTGGFALHPALFDSVLHPIALDGLRQGDGTRPVRLPFAWSDVTLHRAGATLLRARLTPTGENSVALAVTDDSGRPVLSASSLAVRAVDPRQLTAGIGQHDSLFRLDWVPVAAPARQAVAHTAVVHHVAPTAGTGGPEELRERLGRVLTAVQDHLATDESGAPLVVVTKGAVMDDAVDVVAASVWGLVRTAQSEHPDHFLLLDTDTTALSPELLTTALATGEPQLA